ncbi:MAG: hypothetical protein DRJ36_00695 [Thermoprotei archaeon]|nr:MAG: hypothetical protein DRJ36_00695 [Thermoprotei archaeon]
MSTTSSSKATSKTKGKIEKKDEKALKKELQEYVEMINKLDEFRALLLWDPRPIESIARSASSLDVKRAYRNIKGVLYKIAYYPAEVPEMRPLAKKASIFKCVSILCMALMVSLVVLTLQKPAFVERTFGSFYAVMVINVIVAGSMTISIFMEYRLRKRIIKVYESKSFASKKARIGKTVQFLIDQLGKRIKSLGFKPEDYVLELHHRDYKNVVILKESRGVITAIPDVKS